MSETNQTEPIAKTLTSYRRWILKTYNAKPESMSELDFCKRHRIKVRELKVWQRLAGQELANQLKEMSVVEKTVVELTKKTRGPYGSKDFIYECAKVIELTSGGRIREQTAQSKPSYRCELARYRLLQKIASLPSGDRNYRRFTRLRGKL